MRKLRVLTLLVILTTVFAAALPAAAQSKSLVWERFDVTLDIQSNGSVRVTERQAIRFTSGTFSFGFAEIPLDKVGRIFAVGVSEPGGQTYQQTDYSTEPYTYYTNQSGNSLEIRWNFPPASNTTRTFDLTYTVEGAIRIHEDGDKLQWIAIDNERDFPIEAASVTVNLPDGAEFEDIDSAGVLVDWEQQNNGQSVQYVARDSLSASDRIEIGVEFTHGVVPSVKPAWQDAVEADEFYDLNVRPMLNLILGLIAVLLAIGLPVLVYLLWYSRGRDPESGAVPEHISEPPSELRPGVLGSLIDEKADMQDIVATIVDMARRGYLKIEEVEKAGLLGFNQQDHIFRRTDKDDSELRPYEKRILRGIFGSSRTKRELSDLRNKFYRHLDDIQEELYKELVSAGFFKSRPDKTRGRWTAVGFAGIGAAFMAGIASGALNQFAGAVLCIPAALFIGSVSILLAARHMPVKTRQGAEAAAKWEAFRNYLNRIERMTDLTEAGDLFEQFLPYAIAFGMNNSWINKFTRVADAPAPGWYVPRPIHRGGSSGSGGLAKEMPPGSGGGLQSMSDSMAGGLQSMSDGLTRMLNSTGRVLQSAPSSSGSSGGGGFSGGGFSSGGGGGGGSRGFG